MLSKDGFYLTLQHADKGDDLIIDAEDGKQVKLIANVQIANLPQAKTTAIFQVDDAGILTLESIQAEGDLTADEDVLAARLAHYLSTNQYTHQAQSLEAAEQPSPNATIESQDDRQASPEAETTADSPSATSETRIKPVEEESVVLRIKSLFSGREEEIVLPPVERVAVSQSQTVEPRKDDKLPTVSADKNDLLQTDTKPQPDALQIYQSDHITVSRNSAQKGIEVRFTEKPSKEWTQQLSAQKFRFSKKGSDPRWYRKESNVFVSLLTNFAEKYTEAMAIKDQQTGAIAPTEKVQQAISSQTAEKATPAPEAQQIGQAVSKEEAISSEADDAIRPAFKRYLEWKEQYPDSVVLIKTPGIYFETYKEDAVLVADSLKVRISSIPSKSPQYGRVNLSRVFPTSFDSLVEGLQKTTSVVAVGTDNTTTVHPKLEKEVEQASSGKVSIDQSGRLEKAAPQDPLISGKSPHEGDHTFATTESIQRVQERYSQVWCMRQN